MAYKLVTLLVAYLLVITGFAMDAVAETLNTEVDNYGLKDYLDHYYEIHGARALVDPLLFPRAATVTVTETVCTPDGPTSAGDSPIVSIPETTIVTGTSEPSPAPITEQPPVSGTENESPPSAEPTSASAPSSPSDGETTTFQSSSSCSADDTEAPTSTSTFPVATIAPTANAGSAQGKMSSVVLALALMFARLFAV